MNPLKHNKKLLFLHLTGDVPKEIYELSSVYPEDRHIAVSAEIIQETTRILAHRYPLEFFLNFHTKSSFND